MNLINKHKCYLIDMNGVLTDITKPIIKAKEFIDYLNEQKIDYYILTNNSMKSEEDFLEELAKLDIKVRKNSFITSAMITSRYIEKKYPNKEIFLIGEGGLQDEVAQKQLHVTNDPLKAEMLVMGLDSKINYDLIAKGCIVAQRTKKFIVTNSDYVYPWNGFVVPGNGTFRKAIESVTRVKAKNLGKPKKIYFEMALDIICQEKSYQRSDFAMIGDNLQTDIKGANDFKIDSIHVLTGVHKQKDYDIFDVYPTYTIENLAELMK